MICKAHVRGAGAGSIPESSGNTPVGLKIAVGDLSGYVARASQLLRAHAYATVNEPASQFMRL